MVINVSLYVSMLAAWFTCSSFKIRKGYLDWSPIIMDHFTCNLECGKVDYRGATPLEIEIFMPESPVE